MYGAEPLRLKRTPTTLKRADAQALRRKLMQKRRGLHRGDEELMAEFVEAAASAGCAAQRSAKIDLILHGAVEIGNRVAHVRSGAGSKHGVTEALVMFNIKPDHAAAWYPA
jgi:hypothetical protein